MAFEVTAPDVAGVPSVVFSALSSTLITTLATADAVGVFAGLLNPAWGVYLGGVPIVVAEQVIHLEYRHEFNVADFPLEQGAFQSYNKVQIPYDMRVTFGAGQSSAAKTALIQSVRAIEGDLNLYDVVTPEDIVTNVNVVHADYQRGADQGVVKVAVWLQEVRQAGAIPGSDATNPQVQASTAAGATFNPSDPAAVSATNSGTVQPTAAQPAFVNAAGVTVVGPIVPVAGLPAEPVFN